MGVCILSINDKTFNDEIFVLAMCNPKEGISFLWFYGYGMTRLCGYSYGGTPGNPILERYFPCVDAISVSSRGHIKGVSGRKF